MKNTIFEQSEHGKMLQKMWMAQNANLISTNYEILQADFVLVTPCEKSAGVLFLTTSESQEYFNEGELKERVKTYILAAKEVNAIPIFFLNRKNWLISYKMKRAA